VKHSMFLLYRRVKGTQVSEVDVCTLYALYFNAAMEKVCISGHQIIRKVERLGRERRCSYYRIIDYNLRASL